MAIQQNGRDVDGRDLLYNKRYPIGETPELKAMSYEKDQLQQSTQAIDGNIANRQGYKPMGQERESMDAIKTHKNLPKRKRKNKKSSPSQ